MQLTVHRTGLLYLLVLSLLSMAGAASTPSSEELQKQLDSAAQTVDFSHVSGSETPDTAEIRVPPNSTVAVRLSCVGGYRGFLLSGHSGLLALTDVPHKSLTAEEARNLLQEEPSLPSGIKATQPVPFAGSQGSGLGIVGAPVPFLGIVHAETPGVYTLLYSIMRAWAPNNGSRYALKIHVEP
ncbi:uncharacterized protein LOC34617959 [Cyclospora cayetanensis]|uniref:Uncharacterized protein LOC34617959 n=1 Tax=Cyclospora cayetanensis TaxID=88456 RepID=A0A6P6S1H2_9EIME|nr:uncharacterized protein LOC34617959 [Cyclospora cayetanensis]